MATNKAPDWGWWRHVPFVTIREAVALSLNLDPTKSQGLLDPNEHQEFERRVPNVARVGRMLRALDAATRPEQLNLQGFYWHALQGEERWTIRVTGNWWITFGWDGADAVAVDLEDYH